MSSAQRRRGLPAALLCVALLASGCGPSEATTARLQHEPSPAAPVASVVEAQQQPEPPAQPSEAGADSEPQGIDPERLRIPSIGVDAVVIDLGLNHDRTLEVPEDFAETGWWTGGPQPGATGPAVIVGHVDSRTGPAVFYDLPRLVPGDEIEVIDPRGQAVRFRVDRLEQHAKDAFPTDAVYGGTPEPTLRLVTCGGDFDRGSGHYLDNVIVFASLAR